MQNSPNARLTLNKSQLCSSTSYHGIQALIQHFYCTFLPNEIDLGNTITLGQIVPIHPLTVNATKKKEVRELGGKGERTYMLKLTLKNKTPLICESTIKRSTVFRFTVKEENTETKH